MTQPEATPERDRDRSLVGFAWAAGVLALIGLLIAVVMWLLLPNFYPELPQTNDDREVQEIPAARFEAITGRQGRREGSALTVGALENREAVFAYHGSVQADDVGLVRLALSGVPPDFRTELYWSTAEAPERFFQLPLTRGKRNATWHRLAGRDGWNGRIVELGVVVYDPTGTRLDAPLRLESMQLLPVSRKALARLTWQQWTTFSPWTQSAMNNYPGVPQAAAIHPLPIAAAWLLGSLLVVLALARSTRWGRGRLTAALMTVALVPWLAMDGLWQTRLADQVELTQARFGGLSPSAKKSRELDSDLRLQSRQVLAELEPLRGKRLFLVHDSRGHQYFRLRTQYHLLPLNVYNFGRALPDPADVRNGDYLLILDGSERVRFDPARGMLRGDALEMPAQRLERLPRMTLYRLDLGPADPLDDSIEQR